VRLTPIDENVALVLCCSTASPASPRKWWQEDTGVVRGSPGRAQLQSVVCCFSFLNKLTSSGGASP
jgi:hypothetical protein